MQPSLCWRWHSFLISIYILMCGSCTTGMLLILIAPLYLLIFSFPDLPLHSPGWVSTLSSPSYEELQFQRMQDPWCQMARSAWCTFRISSLGRQHFLSLPSSCAFQISSQVLGNSEAAAGGCKRLDSIASVSCFCSARSCPERGFRPLSRILSLQEIHPLCPCCLSLTLQCII